VAVVERGESLCAALYRHEGDEILVRQQQVLSPWIRHTRILREPG
jgi:hypothetical protein